MLTPGSAIAVGDRFSAQIASQLSRTQIVQYAGASGDFNPAHTDEVFARDVAGYDTVFAHGMLTMGMTANFLVDLVGQPALRSFGVRFVQQVWPGDTLHTDAVVTGVERDADHVRVDFEVVTTNQRDQPVLTGTATAELTGD